METPDIDVSMQEAPLLSEPHLSSQLDQASPTSKLAVAMGLLQAKQNDLAAAKLRWAWMFHNLSLVISMPAITYGALNLPSDSSVFDRNWAILIVGLIVGVLYLVVGIPLVCVYRRNRNKVCRSFEAERIIAAWVVDQKPWDEFLKNSPR